MPLKFFIIAGAVVVGAFMSTGIAQAQNVLSTPEPTPVAQISQLHDILVNQPLILDVSASTIPGEPADANIQWDFGDGFHGSGEKVTHTFNHVGSYSIKLRISTPAGSSEDTTAVHVYDRSIVLVVDGSVPDDQLQLRRDQASKAGVLLNVIQAQKSGSDVSTEDDLTGQLTAARPAIDQANLVVTWTSGGIGASVLSKFSQALHTAAAAPVSWKDKGVLLLTDASFGVITPPAQSVFDQLQPSYVVVSRGAALELLFDAKNAEDAKAALLTSPVEYRLLGAFSARTVRDISVTNFVSFGLSYLINRGVPINSIVLILMLPLIATILAFARQVIGFKAFGLVTPTLTTLSFLVMGLQYGLIAFAAVLLAGTITRLLVKRLRLLYLPRMALVLSSVSVAMLLLLGVGSATDRTAVTSFSVFPVLILIILAEEFISVQFTSGARSAFTITAWTLVLSILGYYLVSWELLRTFLLAYPEVTLLTIPLNILIGRWGGLRLTEYFRFRQLLRYERTQS